MHSLKFHLVRCLFLQVLSVLFYPAFCQVETGSIPGGTSIIYSVTNLAISDQDSDTSSFLDIDGNGTYDFRFFLHCGAPIIDDAHLAKIFMLNDSFSFCINNSIGNVALYEINQPICTSGSHDWGMENDYTVSCNGGFECISFYTSATDKYIGYRKNTTGEIGWLKISFDVTNGTTPDSVRFSVSEALVLYLQTRILDVSQTNSGTIFPNPNYDGICYLENGNSNTNITVFDIQGKFIQQLSPGRSSFLLPEQTGIYIIRTTNSQGQYLFDRIIRME